MPRYRLFAAFAFIAVSVAAFIAVTVAPASAHARPIARPAASGVRPANDCTWLSCI